MLKSEKIIGWDGDGVLIDSQTPVINETNQRLGTHFTFEDWLTYAYIFEQAIKLTGETPDAVASWMFSAPIMLSATPYPQALETSRALNELKFRQVVITSRPADQKAVTVDWFNSYYPWIKSDDINLRTSSMSMSGDEFKLLKISELKPLTFTDDSDELITLLLSQVAKAPSQLLLSLIDRPWNRHAKHLDAHRITNFASILEKLKEEQT